MYKLPYLLIAFSSIVFESFGVEYPLDYTAPQKSNVLTITGKGLMLRSTWEVDLGDTLNWQWKKHEDKPLVLAGVNGKVSNDLFAAKKLSITRQIWRASDGESIAVRLILKNAGKQAVHLKSMKPFICKGAESVDLGVPFGQWHIQQQMRLKNNGPNSFVPQKKSKTKKFDSCGLFSPGKGQPVLIMGYINQTDHLAEISLQWKKKNDRAEIQKLEGYCDFTGARIDPGTTRASQWLWFKQGENAPELLAGFADRVGVYHGVTPPTQRAPSVFCSWYFHGRNYTETYFADDMDVFEKEKWPIDVILIDDCWQREWGDWEPKKYWSKGMKAVADRAHAAGYTAGIWTCPYLIHPDTPIAKKNPEWLLHNSKDELITFRMVGVTYYVLDPTHPASNKHLTKLYKKITQTWGFDYLKFDFMRSVFLQKDPNYYDATATSLQAYRQGLQTIRDAVGDDIYINVCGGHYGGSIGLADAQRSGGDVAATWGRGAFYKFRQNILRTWNNRLWQVDPDAVMLRVRETTYDYSDRYPEKKAHPYFSLGKLSDIEAISCLVNQYIGGGMVCFCDYMPELCDERKALYRHIIPSINSASTPLDFFNTHCPNLLLTTINPLCKKLDPWVTISVVNWTDNERAFSIVLDEKVTQSMPAERYVVTEFFTQKVLGLYKKGETISLAKQQKHESKILRIAPWDGKRPVLAGTDLHFSGGGVEIAEWKIDSSNQVSGRIETNWNYPVTLKVLFPAKNKDGYTVVDTTLKAGQKNFVLTDQ